ncbi:MAG: tetratricopeptide repeat protein [Pseudomonadota bacterium]
MRTLYMYDFISRAPAAIAPAAARPDDRPSFRRWTGWLMIALLAFALAACDSVEERAENHYQSGMALLEEGDKVKASLEFRNAIKLNDNHVGANYELGRMFEEDLNVAGAVHQYQKVVALDASQFDAHLRLGMLLLGAGQVEPAAVSITSAAQLQPENFEVLILQATLAMRTGELEIADQKAQEAFAKDENHGDVWVVMSALSRRRGDSEKALEQTNEGLRRDPENRRLLLVRLNLLSELQRREEIGPALERLIALEPEQISFHEALVRWQLTNRKFEEAEGTLRTLSELAPDETERALDIVRLIARTQGREAAIKELARLVELRKGTASEQMLALAMAEIEIEDRQLTVADARLKGIIEAEGTSNLASTARTLLARLRLNEGEMEGAQALINEVLEVDPTNSLALSLRGRIKIMNEDYDAAIRDLRAAEAENPDSVETLQLLALAHQRNGSTDLAGDRLAAAVQVSDYAVPQVLAHARFLARNGKLDFAEKTLQEAISRNPRNVQLVDALARIKLRQRDFAAVEQIARLLQQRDDTVELGDRLLAAALAGQERYDETIDILEQAGDESGRADAYLSALVATHLRNDDLPAAEAVVEKALEAEPNNDDALRLKATLALVNNDREGALALFQQAIAAAPDAAPNHVALFRFYAQSGDRDAAIAALDTGIDQTDAAVLLLNRAMVRESIGDLDGAIADYTEIYERDQGSELIANNLASLITDNNPDAADIDRAFQIARRLRDSEVPQFQDTYGWLLYLRGDLTGARTALSAAVSALPDNPIVQYHYGVVLAELGQIEAARTAFTTALELSGERTIPQIADAQAKLDGLGTSTAQ